MKIPGIPREYFNLPFYQHPCGKKELLGVIREYQIESFKQRDFVTLMSKLFPHSDYDLALMSTDGKCKSSVTDLADKTIEEIFKIAFQYIQFISNPRVTKKYGLQNGYAYLVYNYDEHTIDRESGMSIKDFHLHLNFYKEKTINQIQAIETGKISYYERKRIVDPLFGITRAIFRDMLIKPKYQVFFEESYNQVDTYYAATFRVKQGWKSFLNPEFSMILKEMHRDIEQAYCFILRSFTGECDIPLPNRRHPLLAESERIKNIWKLPYSVMTKELLVELNYYLRGLSEEEFEAVHRKIIFRKAVISLRWLAYSISFFSNQYVHEGCPYVENTVYMNIALRLFSDIGGASILNFPDYPLVKIERLNGKVSESEFEKRTAFYEEFYETIHKE